MTTSGDEAQRDLAILQSNRFLNGVFMTAHWKDLEPTRDKYDFSVLDIGYQSLVAITNPQRQGAIETLGSSCRA